MDPLSQSDLIPIHVLGTRVEIWQVWDVWQGEIPVAGIDGIWPVARVKKVVDGVVPVPVKGIRPVDKFVLPLQL